MSTRCQIGFYEASNNDLLSPDRLIYQHNDGYPDGEHGVLHSLVPFLRLFNRRRGLDDVEYASAWTLYQLISLHVKWGKQFAKGREPSNTFHKDGISCLSYGVSDSLHGDIEYYYAVQGSTLSVYSVQDVDSQEGFHLIKTVNLASTRGAKAVVR